MRGNLAVRIDDGTNDRHVSARVKGLRFTKAANGGHMFAELRVIVPHDTFTDLGPADKVIVYDAATGRTVWEGFVENPGVTDGPAGQEYAIRAQGTVTLASDQSRALVYIDRDLGTWVRDTGGGTAASSITTVAPDPAGIQGDGLQCQFSPGQPIDAGYVAQIAYHAMVQAGMEVGAVYCQEKSGKDDTGYLNRIAWSGPSIGSGSAAIGLADRIKTYATEVAVYAGDAPWLPTGATRVAFMLQRTGAATNVADDNTWSFFNEVRVLGRRMDRYGTLATGVAGMFTAGYVRADWVVEDLLGRVLTLCDPLASTVEAATAQIDQLAYHDGARPQQVFEDLALFEPDMLWEILHSTDRGYVFNYRAWPTTARYEISTRDGYEATGGDNDLCNRIAVYWTDELGNKQTTIVTADVPELGARIRDADPVTLPEGRGSAANALRIGEQVLALKANPPRAARAAVARPIMDRLTGSTVMPWEIEPGYLVRVRETGEDLRLTEVTYDDDSASAELTLGTPARSFEDLLAGLD